jgi:hypothetical protein
MDDIDGFNLLSLDRLNERRQAWPLFPAFRAADPEVATLDDDLVLAVAIRLRLLAQGVLHLQGPEALLPLLVRGESLVDKRFPHQGQADQIAGLWRWHHRLQTRQLGHPWIAQ